MIKPTNLETHKTEHKLNSILTRHSFQPKFKQHREFFVIKSKHTLTALKTFTQTFFVYSEEHITTVLKLHIENKSMLASPA